MNKKKKDEAKRKGGVNTEGGIKIDLKENFKRTRYKDGKILDEVMINR